MEIMSSRAGSGVQAGRGQAQVEHPERSSTAFADGRTGDMVVAGGSLGTSALIPARPSKPADCSRSSTHMRSRRGVRSAARHHGRTH